MCIYTATNQHTTHLDSASRVLLGQSLPRQAYLGHATCTKMQEMRCRCHGRQWSLRTTWDMQTPGMQRTIHSQQLSLLYHASWCNYNTTARWSTSLKFQSICAWLGTRCSSTTKRSKRVDRSKQSVIKCKVSKHASKFQSSNKCSSIHILTDRGVLGHASYIGSTLRSSNSATRYDKSTSITDNNRPASRWCSK